MQNTPSYVTAGIELLDALYETHVEARIRPSYARILNGGGEEVRTGAFALRSYCWCEGDVHVDGCPPNFEHFASGLRVEWYKHSGRSSTAQGVPDVVGWSSILQECFASLVALPRGYRVMVTGSREWVNEPAMLDALRQARQRAGERHMTIVHGAARGADTMAARMANSSPNSHAEAWPALWHPAVAGQAYDREEALLRATVRSPGAYDNRAGITRNLAMLDSQIDEVIAFFADSAQNRGTTHAYEQARRRGLLTTAVHG